MTTHIEIDADYVAALERQSQELIEALVESFNDRDIWDHEWVRKMDRRLALTERAKTRGEIEGKLRLVDGWATFSLTVPRPQEEDDDAC
jgi:hypothetical protein